MSLKIQEIAVIAAATVGAAVQTAIVNYKPCDCNEQEKKSTPKKNIEVVNDTIFDPSGVLADAIIKSHNSDQSTQVDASPLSTTVIDLTANHAIKATLIACGSTNPYAKLAAVRAGDADCTDAIRLHQGTTFGCVQMPYGLHCVSLMDALA